MNLPSFDWSNEILYKMCRDNPLHQDVSVIVGKVLLIGRAYSAAIERKAGAKMVNGESFYLTKVGPKIKDSGIDEWIKSVSLIDRITIENLDSILLCHKKLTDLFMDISGVEKRSLASKYLHFHAPRSFFIYDSIASKNLRKLQSPVKHKFDVLHQDLAYSSFCHRCLAFRENLEKQMECKVNPRELDKYLLSQ